MSGTLRRGTKAFKAALDAAKPSEVMCYSLEDGFRPRPVESFERWHPRDELARFDFAKLSANGSVFILKVHSNLWYEWPAPKEGAA